MGSNYVLFIFKPLLFIFHSHISAPSRWFRFMVFNATFNNISVISWLPVLLMEETGVPREITDLLSLANFITCCIAWAWFELATLVAIGIDCISGCKSSYYTITTTPLRTSATVKLLQLVGTMYELVNFVACTHIYIYIFKYTIKCTCKFEKSNRTILGELSK